MVIELMSLPLTYSGEAGAMKNHVHVDQVLTWELSPAAARIRASTQMDDLNPASVS